MGLISPRRGNLLDFLELQQVLSTYVGDLRDLLWWPQERPIPKQVARGPLEIPLPSMPGPKILCGVGARNGAFLSSADMDLGVLLESPQGSQSSSGSGACTCAFVPSCSSSVALPFPWIKGSVAFPRGFPTKLSHEAFPRGYPTGLSHVPPWCELILDLKVEAVQGNQVSLEWTETSGVSGNDGKTLEFLSPFLWRAPPLEMRRERREFFPEHAAKGCLLSR